jgi:hypothetical protein
VYELTVLFVLSVLLLSFYFCTSFWDGLLFDPPEDKSKRWNHRMKPTNFGVRVRMATLEQRWRPLRNIKPPRWMRRRRPSRAKVKFKWAPLDKTEAETDRWYEYDQRKHQLFSHAETVFELQFGFSLDHFVTSIDPLRQWRMLRQAADPLALAPTQRAKAWTRAAEEAMAIAADIRRAIPNTSRIWTIVECHG